jgi:hypothetical protein
MTKPPKGSAAATGDDLLKWPVHLLRVCPPREVEEVSSASWDTIKRNHPELVVQVSERRVGMRLGHALRLAGSK